MSHWLALAIAIIAEVIGTTALKASNEFTRLIPSLIVVVGYGTAFYFMSISMRVLPVGIMYAIWSGMGIVLISVLGWLVFRQTLDMPAMIGLAFIIAGVIIINVFSKTVGH
ncbi:DMT family transporter [Methylotenera versatilis]|uniref:Small multidrug resistance protein n=1 Tax=Methylotenera versatilis (strain 301) TaxID=666681 RepID=D7DPF8_METV0|nr:SMR family transporter [Methylotenera versatilis]ADI29202.1 small multidrug resistance protein [Methylotenera versatilis 301]